MGKVIAPKNSFIDQRIRTYWYSQMIKGSYTSYISEVYFTRNNQPRFTMTVFVRDDLFDIDGILIAEINLHTISPLIKNLKIGQTGFSYIVDNNGIVIAHSKLDEEINKDYSVKPAVIDVLNRNVRGLITKDNNEKYLAAYVPVLKYNNEKELSMGVIIQQKTSEAYKSAEDLENILLFILLFCLIIASVIGIIYSHSITSPLNLLVKKAKEIANGNLENEIFVKSSDEIKHLSQNFDVMRLNLKKKMDDLKLIYTVGQAMSSILEYDELLDFILSKNCEVMDAEKGSIMLFDEETEKLSIKVAKGIESNIIENTSIEIGKGIAGYVAQTGKSLLIRDTENEPGFFELKGRAIEKGTMLSVPLKIKDRIIGIMNVSKSVPNSFSDEDLDLFSTIANQAAIALDNAKLYKMAITDGLTKLFIHRYFQQRLEGEINRARRYSENLSLVMLDIDHFKTFNDTYGHQNGDRVLKEVSKCLQNSVREVDILARYGGEEFAIICPELDSEATIIPVERIRKSVENAEFFVDGKRVPITISLGVASYPGDAEDKNDLIHKADNALYLSKEKGRNCFSLYSEINKNS
jgi:diguanylate cyclase (GGDEF)-like protein